MKIYDDRQSCSRCGNYMDQAALDRLPRDALVHRAGPLICTECAHCDRCGCALEGGDLNIRDRSTCSECVDVARLEARLGK